MEEVAPLPKYLSFMISFNLKALLEMTSVHPPRQLTFNFPLMKGVLHSGRYTFPACAIPTFPHKGVRH